MLVKQGRAPFHVSGSGHEAMAALASALVPNDVLHLHYRDKALLIARGLPITEFFRSLFAKSNSHSAGRQMSAHFSWPSINITSTVGPVGNNALHAVGVAAALKSEDEGAIAVCAVGDGTTQQGEFLEAVAEAVRSSLPVLFVIEDNGLAISTRTAAKTFFDGIDGLLDTVFGMPINRFDGSDAIEAQNVFQSAVRPMRIDRRPRLLVGKFERLADHTNSDDQSTYRAQIELDASLRSDPLIKLEKNLLDGILDFENLNKIKDECDASIDEAVEESKKKVDFFQTSSVLAPLSNELSSRAEYTGREAQLTLSMRQSINEVLRLHLSRNERVVLTGQDIEDPKGDVFGLTKGLSTDFPKRVQNAPLTESTIVGTSIGRALAGERPIAFIQFADFLPLAANQIVSELATMYWRTNGGWQCPVVIMAPVGAYKPGLGPFHSQSFEALFAQCPGLNIALPSNAADAAGLLNAALLAEQPTLFLYPKALLNQTQLATSDDVDQQFVHPGRLIRRRQGNDLTIVCWGNTVSICTDVAERLAKDEIGLDVLDLRTISPWDRSAVIESARRTHRLIVVHEDNVTMGFGAEIIAHVAEACGKGLSVRRVGRPDTYIPFNFDDQLSVLPSYQSVMDACLAILEIDYEWQHMQAQTPSSGDIVAVGSGPSDDAVTVVELNIATGSAVAEGDLLAIVEASKAAVEIRAQRRGRIASLCCAVGDEIAVGDTIAIYDSDTSAEADISSLDQTRESQKPRLNLLGRRRLGGNRSSASTVSEILLADVAVVAGDRSIATEELCQRWPDRTPSALISNTGIRSRRWISSTQTPARHGD